jgi:hypothetical protein
MPALPMPIRAGLADRMRAHKILIAGSLPIR